MQACKRLLLLSLTKLFLLSISISHAMLLGILMTIHEAEGVGNPA